MPAPHQRRRAYKPKVRSGCAICKTRRVKCDERKPTCVRCEKAGWNCEYELTVKLHPTAKNSRKLLPAAEPNAKGRDKQTPVSTKRSNRTIVVYQPSSLIHVQSPDEFRYFQVFEKKTAVQLTGYFESNIWNRLILQATHIEQYAWHAVVAIGALHQALEASQRNRQRLGSSLISNQHVRLIPEADSDSKTHHMFALRQYAKALQMMKLTSETRSNFVRDALLSSLLTTCFESFMGNQQMAHNQAQSGVNILLEQEYNNTQPEQDEVASLRSLAKSSSFLDDDLLAAFVMLDFQSMTFRHVGNTRRVSDSFPTIPQEFSGVKEARMYLDVIFRRTQQWNSAVQAQYSTPQSTLDYGENLVKGLGEGTPLERRVAAELILFHKVVREWEIAFQPLFEASRANKASRDYLGATVLMARATVCHFVFSQTTAGDETYTDEYLSDFTHVVGMVKDVYENDPNGHPGKSVFVFTNSCVLALFIIGLRCRNSMVRRRAITLLAKYPRREGLWDSVMSAKISTWIMLKEEEGMVNGFVPESARLRIVQNDFVLSERKAVFRCSRLLDGSTERQLLPEVTLTW